MSNLTAFKNAGLPAVKSMAAALKSIKAPDVGSVILKMDKTGHWVFGADQTEVEKEAEWAINPFSFVHGYIAWGEGVVLGEKMVNITAPLPELDEAPKDAKKGWEAQVGFAAKCLNGEDKDMEVTYTVTSVGGKRAVQGLGAAIAEQIEKDPSCPVPVVVLGKEHYTHKSYGRIYTPIFEIVDWIGMDGEQEEVEQIEAAPKEAKETVEVEAVEAAPARRRRSV